VSTPGIAGFRAEGLAPRLGSRQSRTGRAPAATAASKLAFLFRHIPVEERRLARVGRPPPLAFHFRSIPAKERQLRSAPESEQHALFLSTTARAGGPIGALPTTGRARARRYGRRSVSVATQSHWAAHACVFTLARTTADFCPALLGCLERLGGVPREAVFDNDPAVVASRSGGIDGWNRIGACAPGAGQPQALADSRRRRRR
jgi:hypothetical protein